MLRFIRHAQFRVVFTALLFSVCPAHADVARPSIWVKESERVVILDKIRTEPWARSLFDELERRVEPLASETVDTRHQLVSQLPLLWKQGKGQQPILPVFRVKTGGGTETQLTAVVKALQDGVDCGVMYYLTQQEKYGMCGADILFTVINALQAMPVNKQGGFNSGWMFPNDHLYEARVIGAQLPVIYDFVHTYVEAGGKVYDVVTEQLVPFDSRVAQTTFETYIWLALNQGLLDSNWPVLESSSLVHNILALDDPEKIRETLPYYTQIDTEHQASLRMVSEMFEKEGDIWPESLGYSRHVAAYSVYLMTLLDRYDPSLKLGAKYPNIPAAFMSYYDLQFPNEEYPFFGDGHRTYKIEYSALEMSYLLGQLNDDKKLQTNFGNYLTSSIQKGRYDRGHLHDRSYGPSPYFTPTQLLWYPEKIASSAAVDIAPPRPRTKRLEFAGMNIQRNISKTDPVTNSLMAFVAGGSYIHGHASGMDTELYGQGYVLGVDSGKSTYRTDIHENYYRIFAGHNSVISNGASASQGDWINLGINKVEALATEPAYNEPGVAENYSFSTSTFFDEFNLVAPAYHQRTMALVRVSDTQGYYLDIFKAKSDTPDQFHDFVYHNIGDNVEVTSQGQPVTMRPDPERYQGSNKIKWILQRQYKHPGWHFFKDVKSSGLVTQPLEATFTANKLEDQVIYMRAIMPADSGLEITTTMAPKTYGSPGAYKEEETPTMVLRRQGEAWKNPFVVAFESKKQGEDYAVQSVERIEQNGHFKGAKVTVVVAGRQRTQFVLMQDNESAVFEDQALGLIFKGHFAIVTIDENRQLVDMYIGQGSQLQYQSKTLVAESPSQSAYQKF